MLAAGYYVQQHAADDSFATADANKRLTEQGIKLGNPSQCVKQSVLSKRVFMVTRGRYRVSQHGRQHLRQLLGPSCLSGQGARSRQAHGEATTSLHQPCPL